MPHLSNNFPNDKVLRKRYRLIKQLGAGNMGAVYLAYEVGSGRNVAIKQNTRNEEWLRKQFSREAAVLYGLRHPVLPEVFEYLEEGVNQYLVMEYIPGDDLSQTLRRRSEHFEIEAVEWWAEQLLSALEYMHAHSLPVIHRDIKPANIKVTSDGKVYLLDFGLARGGALSSDSTDQTVFGCTVEYASPEQILRVNQDIRSTLIPFLTTEEVMLYVYGVSEPRNDIYSLAASLYHLLTRTRPPNAASRLAEIKNGRPDPLRPANQLRPEIPLHIANALRRSMELDKNKRTASAAEMRDLFFPDAEPTTVPASTQEEATRVATATSTPGLSRPKLYVLGPPEIRQTIELGDEELIIGREEGQLCLPTDTVMSPRHASIFSRGGQFFVKDLDSLNSIYKRIVKEAELFQDDVILIADLEFKIHYSRGGLLQLTPIAKNGATDHPYSFNLDGAVIGTDPALYKFHRHQTMFMSPRQARLTYRPPTGHFVLVDESLSGTNFKKIRGEEPLHEGDLLLIGTTFFNFGVN
jgi:serine/threonine protein kinase